MRRAAKVDSNHGDIVRALRDAGCSVQSLANLGGGVPDLLVGVRGRNFLMEVKDGRKVPSAQRLTGPEAAWHSGWKGQVVTVRSKGDALRVVWPHLGKGSEPDFDASEHERPARRVS